MFWNQYPAFRILIPFTIGIGLKLFAKVEIDMLWPTFALLLIFIWEKTVIRKIRNRWRTFSFCIYPCIICIAGCSLATTNDNRYHNDYYQKHVAKEDYLLVRITEPAELRTKSIKAICTVEYIVQDSEYIPTIGNIILYFQSDTLNNFHYGDLLLIKNKLNDPTHPKNPYEFNYPKFLATQNIYQIGFLKKNEWVKIIEGYKNPVYSFSFFLRERSVALMKKYIPDPESAGVAEALVFGYRNDLDKEIESQYSEAGVVHVLAVSGMHVSILLWLINLLLFPVGKNKKLRWAKAVLVLGLTWLFALMTGMSGSVVRAAAMFTFVTVGEASGKVKNNFNLLAISAIAILLFSPNLLMDVGVQLSYAAMCGIYLLNRPLGKWLESWQKIPAVNGTITTSLSAQFGTLPISLFYFSQFPVYFLIANLIIIPASTFVLLSGIGLVALSFIPSISYFAGIISSFSILRMNEFIKWMNTLPVAVIRFGEISLGMALLMSLALWQTYVFFSYKKKKALYIALVSFILLSGLYVFQTGIRMHNTKMTLFNMKGMTLISFKSGENNVILSDKNISSFDFYTKKYFEKFEKTEQIKDQKFYKLTDSIISNELIIKNKNLIRFDHHLLMLVDSVSPVYVNAGTEPLPIDYLLLTHNSTVDLEQLAKTIDFHHVIADHSNKFSSIRKWKLACKKINVDFYATNEQGAFILQR